MVKSNKKSQIAAFIIIALVIVTAALLFFLLKPNILTGKTTQENVDAYITKCMEDSAKEIIENISKQGGYTYPENYVLYENEKIGYTCYNIEYYKSCIMQTPQITGWIAQEIEDYISPRLESCYNQIKREMEKKDYSVVIEEGELNVKLSPNKVELDSRKQLLISKNDERYSYNGFKTSFISPLYDFSQIALEISNQEAKFCNFEYLGYMLLYPRWSIEKDSIDGEIKIYTIKEKSTGKEFRFAIRSCAFPAGM